MDNTTHVWWLSFVNEEGDNLGVCLVEAEGLEGAIKRAWDSKCNPGGGVAGMPLEPAYAKEEIERWGLGTLISPEKLKEEGYKSTRTEH